MISIRDINTPLDIRNIGFKSYKDTLKIQNDIHDLKQKNPNADDVVILVEHESVYTAGKRTLPEDLPKSNNIPVYQINRGGKITWHGPGQIIGYPIIKLNDPIDVVKYVRILEQIMIDVCQNFGVKTTRIEGKSGVWLPGNRKIGSVGIRVAKNITMHGFSLNCSNDLTGFNDINPCGIIDAKATSLSQETEKNISPLMVIDPLRNAILNHLDQCVNNLQKIEVA